MSQVPSPVLVSQQDSDSEQDQEVETLRPHARFESRPGPPQVAVIRASSLAAPAWVRKRLLALVHVEVVFRTRSFARCRGLKALAVPQDVCS